MPWPLLLLRLLVMMMMRALFVSVARWSSSRP
jgi:hypothetical protein